MSETELTYKPRGGTVQGESNKDSMDELITKATARHIAKCLDDLGCSVSPSQARTIKRWFWLLSDDIKQAQQGEANDQEQYYEDTFGA